MAPSSPGVCEALPITPYSAERTTRAALELSSLPPDAELPQMMQDYRILRARRRAVCGE